MARDDTRTGSTGNVSYLISRVTGFASSFFFLLLLCTAITSEILRSEERTQISFAVAEFFSGSKRIPSMYADLRIFYEQAILNRRCDTEDLRCIDLRNTQSFDGLPVCFPPNVYPRIRILTWQKNFTREPKFRFQTRVSAR